MAFQKSQGIAALSLFVLASVCLWGTTLYPQELASNGLILFSVTAVWAFLEKAQGGTNPDEKATILVWHRRMIAFMALFIVSVMGPELAVSAGSIEPRWEPFAMRLRGLFLGFGLAFWGNSLPKLLSPWTRNDEPFAWHAVHRFVGWLAALSGISLIMTWWYLPIERARLASAIILVTFTLLAAGRKLLSLASKTPHRENL